MDKGVASSSSSSHDVAQRLYDKNIELENRRRKSAQARVPSDPNAWQQMRENFETIILEDHSFSEKHNIEFALWQLHYRRIEEFRAHYSAASASVSSTNQTRGGPARPDRASKIRSQFKTFLSEATGFYHDLILKIRAKYGLPIGQFYPEQDNHVLRQKDGKKSIEIKKGLISCHRCLIYLGDLARYKGLYGEGESKNRDYAAASSYYLQAASLWPSSGNPHHQLAILATYSGDELMAVYRYFRSLAAEQPFSTAKDNLIVAFEKNRQSYTQLHADSNDGVKESSVKTKGRGRGKEDPVARSKEPVTETEVAKTPTVRQTLKVFRVGFVRLNGVLFTHTSLETFEDILPVVISALQELLSSGSGDESGFGTDADENGLFIVILVSILIFTVNNVKGGTEGQSYADIVQNTVLLKNALITFYEITSQLLKRCIQLSDPFSSFLLPGILVCVEWIACNLDVVISKETGERRSVAQTKFWSYCVSLFNKFLSAGLVSYDEEDTSCFTDMTSYEEGSNEYQSALWEDFELRGFLPLEPAHTFLDFSRKHLDGKKDQVARVKRIMSAWRIISDKITIDHKKVRFDPKLKKFVIGAIGIETEKETSGSKLYRGTKETSSDTTATVIPKQLKVEACVECEEEEEEIVFRPSLIDNRTEVLNQQEVFENTSQSAAPNVSMPQSNLDTVYNNSQSLLPADTYAQSFGQPVNNSYTQSVVPPVNHSYTQSVVPPVNNSYTQSVGPPVNNNYAQSVGPPGPPVNNSYAQSVGPSVNNSYSQSIGQTVNDSYIQSMGQPVNNNFTHKIGQSYQFQSPMWSGNRQIASSVAGGLQGLSLRENGHSGGSGMMHTGPSQSMARPPVIDYSNPVALSETDSYAMGRYTSTNMPPSSLKTPMNRPIRHFGPPPGFSSVRPKQVNEPSSASGQNPLNDDYSWLNGYQLQSSMKGGFLPSNMNSQYLNDSVATSSFPFPGKQVPTVRFEGELQKNMDQQQYVTQMDQQGQPVWKGNHFV